MQEHRIEGPDRLNIDIPEADFSRDLFEALKDDRNTAVTVHKPGSMIRVPGRGMEIFKHGKKQGPCKPGGLVVCNDKIIHRSKKR